jgi:hypothetical protein
VATATAIDPTTSPANPPSPREPSTTSPAEAELAISWPAADPLTSWVLVTTPGATSCAAAEASLSHRPP